MDDNLAPIPWEELDDGHMQLSEKVAMHLREQIVSGQLKEGDFLRIESIAKALGVSPTPVREGLLLLKSEALVRLMPRRGFRVCSFSKQDLLDLFWAQATIGAELAARAATQMPTEQMNQLDALQVEYEIAIRNNDEKQIARLGHQFHRTINLASDSQRLAYLLGSLTRQLPNRFYASIEGHLSTTVQYHPIILGAIKLRDPVAASSLMFRHINEGGQLLVEMLEKRGLWAEEKLAAAAPAIRGRRSSSATKQAKPSVVKLKRAV